MQMSFIKDSLRNLEQRDIITASALDEIKAMLTEVKALLSGKAVMTTTTGDVKLKETREEMLARMAKIREARRAGVPFVRPPDEQHQV